VILSATNCVAVPLKKLRAMGHEVRFISRVRCDVLADQLNGSVKQIDYNLIPEECSFYKIRNIYAPGTPLGNTVDSFFWTPYIDEHFRFFNIDGLPVSPETHGKISLQRHLELLPKMPLLERVEHWINVDAVLNRINPNMKKILILYDFSRLIRNFDSRPVKSDTPEGHAMASALMCHVLQPLGWKLVFTPFGMPQRADESDREWSHYDHTKMWLDLFKPLLLEEGIINE